MSARNIRIFLFGFATAIVFDVAIRYFIESNHQKKHHGRPLLITYGDSITQRGFDGWVGLLADWYTRKVDILNRGFSGYQSRWGWDMFQEVVLNNFPDVLIIFFGANDAVSSDVLQHVPLDKYKSNIVNMVVAVQKKLPKTKMIIITPPPVYEPDLELSNSAKGKTVVSDRSNKRTKEYADACKDIGSMYKIAVIDAWAGLGADTVNRQQYLMDGLHFNTEGNRRLFELVQQTIITSLPEWIPDNLPMHMKPWNEMK